MKTYVVADLHGRYDLLQKVLKLIEDKDEPLRFVCLGDFVDRGPQSKQIIERFIEGPKNPKHDWVILQGNHEAIMLAALAEPFHLKWWRENGGTQTLKSYGAHGGNNPRYTTERVPHQHRAFLQNLPDLFEDEHRIYVHAGVPFKTPLDEVPKGTRQWMMYREKGVDEYKDAIYADGLGVHISGKHVVHGHVQHEDHPLVLEGRTNLDSFAYHTGRLAVGVFDGPGGPQEILYVQGKPEQSYLDYLENLAF